ncbi:outer membrane protein assembly factor BamB family protein [Archaeoglobus sp.]
MPKVRLNVKLEIVLVSIILIIVCLAAMINLQDTYYFVGGKVITGVKGSTSYTIAVALYDDTGIRLIVKDRDFNFTEDLTLNDSIKRELEWKYSQLSYILKLCDENGCTGYIVSEDDFKRAEIGSIVKVRAYDTEAEVLEVVEEGVIKPFYVFNVNESKAKELWMKAGSLVDLKYPFSGIVLRHTYTTGGDFYAEWFVIVTTLDLKNSRVTNVVLRFDDSLKLLGTHKTVKPLKWMKKEDAAKLIEEAASRFGTMEFFHHCKLNPKQFGWYYVYYCPPSDLGGTIIVEKHSGLAFFATSVWAGEGELVFPEMYKEICKTDKPPESMVREFLPDVNKSWRMVDADCGCTRSVQLNVPGIAEVQYNYRFSEKILFNPLIENGTIFVASERGIRAIDEKTGKGLWNLNVSVNCYALGKYLYVGSKYLLAIDKKSGEVIWTANVSNVKSILLAEGYIVAANQNGVFTLSEDGSILWGGSFNGNVSAVCAGNSRLFLSVDNKIYALDLSNGQKIWEYEHWCRVDQIAYKSGMLFVVNRVGNIAVLDEDGNPVWEIDAGVGKIAIGRAIYASKTLDKSGLIAVDYNGNTTFTFDLPEGESPGAPVATDNVVILPSMKPESYGKVYLLWHDGKKLFELKHDGRVSEQPKVSVAYGKIYALFQYDETHYVLYVLGDSKAPRVFEYTNFSQILANQEVRFWVKCSDESGIYKAIFAYRVNGSVWHYVEMDCGCRFREDSCQVLMPPQPANSIVDYGIILVDNVGNYSILKGQCRQYRDM